MLGNKFTIRIINQENHVKSNNYFLLSLKLFLKHQIIHRSICAVEHHTIHQMFKAIPY